MYIHNIYNYLKTIIIYLLCKRVDEIYRI